jgi:hypothetical protein
MSGDGTQHPSTSGPIPAGWYPDPAGGDGKRWWDGSAWTHNVQAPEVAPAAPSFGNYVSAEFRPSIAFPTAEVGTAYTRASWWIAFSPLWVSVPLAVVLGILDSLAPAPVPTLVLGISLFTVLGWAITVQLAFADRAGLIRGGNNSAASPWWVLLTPIVYLVMRARQVQLYATGGWASVIWWCIAVFVAPGVSLLAFFGGYGLV